MKHTGKNWDTGRRSIDLSDCVAVMGILNVTPDSFSDGGRYAAIDAAVTRVDQMIAEGAEIIDVGGESTRPGSARVPETEEIGRVVPIINAISARFDIPISIDTSKSVVADAAVNAGAEIINDISGLRFDESLADVARRYRTGLILMHSRGEFETMHSLPPVSDVSQEVKAGLNASIRSAEARGVKREQIVLDVGIGFGKSPKQNLELIAKLDKIALAFPEFPLLVGASRKSFIGKTLGRDDPSERLPGSIAAAVISVFNGAEIIRAHDVKETVDAVRLTKEIMGQL